MKKLNIILLTIVSLLLLIGVTGQFVSHSASEITAATLADGTFGPGDYTFTNNKEVFISIKNTEAGGHDYRLVSAGSVGGIGLGKFSIYDTTTGISRLTIDETGNVEVLGDIKASGSIQVGSVSALISSDCNTPGSKGKLVFFTVPNKFYTCDGSKWEALTSSGVDNDGDGVPQPQDCDDDDINIFQLRSCYIDNDGDGEGHTQVSPDIYPDDKTKFSASLNRGGGGSVSSLSKASVQPGSAGKSVNKSPSLSIVSEH